MQLAAAPPADGKAPEGDPLSRAGIRAADIYTRRNMWLVLFGMLHAYLIWYGDILYWYGLTALLFLFPFLRK